MGDENQALEIVITSRADTKGFQDVATQSKNLQASTVSVTEATKQQIQPVQQLEDAHKKAGKAAEEEGISHRELRRVLMELGQQVVPNAAGALSEMALGPVGAGIAIVGVYELVVDKLKEVAEQQQKLLDAAATPDTAGIEAVKKAWDDNTKSMTEYFVALQKAGKDADPIATMLKNITQLTEVNIDAIKKETDALAKLEEAVIRVNGQKAGLSPAEIQAQVDALSDANKAKQNDLDKQKAEASGSGGLITEQQWRTTQEPELEQAQKEASEKAAKLDAQWKNDEANLAIATDITVTPNNPTTKQGKELLDRRNEAETNLRRAEDAPVDGAEMTQERKAEMVRQAQEEMDQVQKEYEMWRTIHNNLNSTRQARSNEVGAADRDKVDADKAVDNNTARLRKLPGEIDQAKKVEAAQAQGEKTAADITTAQHDFANATNALVGGVKGMLDQHNKDVQTLAALAQDLIKAGDRRSDTARLIQQAIKELQIADEKLLAQMRQASQNDR